MSYHFSCRLTAILNICLIYFKMTWALAILLEHMHKKFEINQTKIKGGCQSGRKVVTHNSMSDLPLISTYISWILHRLRHLAWMKGWKNIHLPICVEQFKYNVGIITGIRAISKDCVLLSNLIFSKSWEIFEKSWPFW